MKQKRLNTFINKLPSARNFAQTKLNRKLE